MERLMFSFHRTINGAYSIAAYFTRGSPIFPGNIKKQYTLVLHVMQAPVWVFCALLKIVIFPVSVNFSSCYQKIFKHL